MFYIFSRNIPLHCMKISAKVTQQKKLSVWNWIFFCAQRFIWTLGHMMTKRRKKKEQEECWALGKRKSFSSFSAKQTNEKKWNKNDKQKFSSSSALMRQEFKLILWCNISQVTHWKYIYTFILNITVGEREKKLEYYRL